MTSLEDFAKGVFAPTEAVFSEQQSVSPMWFLDSPDGIMVVCTPWGSDQERDAAIAYLRTLMKEKGVTRYASLAEVWTLSADKEQGLPESIRLGGAVASHPDRREAVILIAQDKSGDCVCITRYILRPEVGKATLSEPDIKKFNNKSLQGRMANLLED